MTLLQSTLIWQKNLLVRVSTRFSHLDVSMTSCYELSEAKPNPKYNTKTIARRHLHDYCQKYCKWDTMRLEISSYFNFATFFLLKLHGIISMHGAFSCHKVLCVGMCVCVVQLNPKLRQAKVQVQHSRRVRPSRFLQIKQAGYTNTTA